MKLSHSLLSKFPVALGVWVFIAGCSDPVPLRVVNDSGTQADSASDAQTDQGTTGACAANHGTCNIVSGEGCAPGRGCYRVRTTETECTNPGSGGEGSPCNSVRGDLDCQPGFQCDEAFNRCLKLCCDVGECGSGSSGSTPTCYHPPQLPSGVGFCWSGCDVFATSNTCPEEFPYCQPFQAQNAQVAFLCQRRMQDPPVSEGASCRDPADCETGHTCAGGVCRKLCTPQNSTHPCPTGRRCAAADGIPGFGACLP
jgi:hypothetical protein